MTTGDDLAAAFERQRPRLRAVATRLLGSAAEAEDAVQDAWLRLQRVDTGDIDNLDAWLTTVVSRISLDRLRAPAHTRWSVMRWDEEPVAHRADPAEEVERDDRVAVALLVVLDQLSPAERLAFVLHDVFGRPFSEIAEALDRSPEAARQLASRARSRVRGAPEPGRTDRGRERAVVTAWLAAVETGDLRSLLGLLDENAVLRADYGATSQVLDGPAAIGEMAVLSGRLAAHSIPVLLGGRPGVAAVIDGRVVSLMAFEIEGDRITGLDVLADPEVIAGLRVLESLS